MVFQAGFLPLGEVDIVEEYASIRSCLTHVVFTGGVIALARIAGYVAQDNISSITGNAILGAFAGGAIEVGTLIGSKFVEHRISELQSGAVLVGQMAGMLAIHVLFRGTEPKISSAAGAAVGALAAGRWSMLEVIDESSELLG